MSNGNELKKASIADLPCLKIGQKQCLCEISCEDCIESHVLAEGYRKQSEWISVEERLPDLYGTYLVRTFHNLIKLGRFCEWIIGEDPGFGDYAVTHWMPLPEPPKGE